MSARDSCTHACGNLFCAHFDATHQGRSATLTVDTMGLESDLAAPRFAPTTGRGPPRRSAPHPWRSISARAKPKLSSKLRSKLATSRPRSKSPAANCTRTSDAAPSASRTQSRQGSRSSRRQRPRSCKQRAPLGKKNIMTSLIYFATSQISCATADACDSAVPKRTRPK